MSTRSRPETPAAGQSLSHNSCKRALSTGIPWSFAASSTPSWAASIPMCGCSVRILVAWATPASAAYIPAWIWKKAKTRYTRGTNTISVTPTNSRVASPLSSTASPRVKRVAFTADPPPPRHDRPPRPRRYLPNPPTEPGPADALRRPRRWKYRNRCPPQTRPPATPRPS